MEQISNKEDLNSNLLKQSSNLSPLSLKTSILGKSSPRNPPSLRKLGSSKLSRRDYRVWIRNNKVVFVLLMIAIWACIGFHVQSQWAHGDHNNKEFISHKSVEENMIEGSSKELVMKGKKNSVLNFGVNLLRKKGRKLSKMYVQPKKVIEENIVEEIPRKNISYGSIVGPFDKIEDSIIGWGQEKRRRTCSNRKGEFARIVYSQNIILIFHELSMTGSPLSMLGLGSEILSCGGSVSAIVLNKRGGLMKELNKRGIKIIKDRGMPSFKTAKKVDLIIAGSVECSSWIEPYLNHYPAGSGQILWWIMENSREYFDRSKHLLNRVKILTFISDSQFKQWLSWCKEEKIKFYFEPMVAPLSINDEIAFVAGIPSSLNTPALSAEKMIEKRDVLRSAVRKEMRLGDNDMLVMSLSSISQENGQHLLLEAALSVARHSVSLNDIKKFELLEEENLSVVASQNHTIKPFLQLTNQTEKINAVGTAKTKKKKKEEQKSRYLLSRAKDKQEGTLKILIGFLGTSGNEVSYVKEIMKFVSEHLDLSNAMLWTPTATHVAALYAAADVYVINSQGLGETFGRATVEAMAFGLPVLGTDAGGTREIVDHRVTGLLHPAGHEGTQTLARNIQYLLSNPSARKKMGMNGRRKVLGKYLKHQAYESLAKVLFKCMRPKSANHWNF